MTCGFPLPASFYSVSVETEMFFQDVVLYKCKSVYTVTGLLVKMGLSRGAARSSQL